MPPNGEEKQLINKDKHDEASLASETSSVTEKKEEYEDLSTDNVPIADQEERGPIKDRSCTDVLCLGRILLNLFERDFLVLFVCLFVYDRPYPQVYSLPFLACGQVLEKVLGQIKKNFCVCHCLNYSAGVGVWAFRSGDPSKLLFPTNSFGQICGQANPDDHHGN